MYEEDEDFFDDPISLMYEELPKDNVQKCTKIYDDDEMEDDPIILVTNPYETYLDTEIVDLRSSDDEYEEPHPTPTAGYGNKNFVIPVTFLDFYRNVKLLKRCRPLSIQVVDCDKHPWYYGYHGTSKSRVNTNCRTLGNKSNIITQEIKVEKDDNDNEEVKVEVLPTTNQSKDKIQDQGILNQVVDGVTYPRKEVPITESRSLNGIHGKLDNEIETAKKLKDISQVDLKRNSGLVGLTISKKNSEPNLEKVTEKKSPKKRKKDKNFDKPTTKQIGGVLGNFETSVTPVPGKIYDNMLNDLTKDSHTNNVTIQELSYNSSDTGDNVNNKIVGPTRCSLKITSTKIIEKLKKNKVQDSSKTKSQQKPKNIFAKDQAVPKLSLKRRPTTENDEFYVVKSNKPRFNCPSTLSQSQEPQKDENAVDNIIHKEKPVASYPPVTPSIANTVANLQQKKSSNTPVIAEKLDQTQSYPTLPTPRSYHKKLKLKKSVLDSAPNKTIENETTTSDYSNTLNNEAVSSSDCSLTPGLNHIVVSQVQSLRNLKTLTPYKPNSEAPKNTAIYVAKPRHLNLKNSKEIDVVPTANNFNENVVEGANVTTDDNKVKKTSMLQSPSVSYLQVYNAHVLKYYKSRQELSEKTNKDKSNKDKNDSKLLKDTKKNATEQNQTNLPKYIISATNNNKNATNYYIPNRDTVTSDANFNNSAISPKTPVHVQRFGNKQQPEGHFNMKQHHPNTQHNPTDTNKYTPLKTQVYSLPGNNTVILRKPPAHLQTGTQSSSGLPIPTVINLKPVNTPQSPARFQSPWPFPPPNTNVAFSVPYNMPDTNVAFSVPYNMPNTIVGPGVPYSMPNMNMYPGNPMYSHYYRQPTNLGNPYSSSMVPQPERNTNFVPVRNEVRDDSIIGSTANGDLIKKINIVVPTNDSAVVNDKQKMLDTLNNAINDSIHEPSDPRITAKIKAKPCPLSKKTITNPPELNIEPSKGYSPPILPIPTFQKAIELVKMKQKVHNSFLRQEENMNNNVVNKNSKVDGYGHRTATETSKKKFLTIDDKKRDKTKKISIEEYKRRVSKDGEANKSQKHRCKKMVSKNLVIDNNQDLGYDSDATVKL